MKVKSKPVKKKECDHYYVMFHNAKYTGSGYMTLYCRRCLKLVKRKIDVDYEEIA